MAVREPEIMPCLQEHPFLQGFTAEHLVAIGRCARWCDIGAGQYLWRQGEPADCFYLIQSGQIALEIMIPNQGPLQIETVGAGEVFGWSWLTPPHRWLFDVRTVTDVRAVVLNGACLREQCERNESLGYAWLNRLVPVIGHRLETTRLKLLELYESNKTAPAR